jgi:hypothetical protein
MALYAPKTIRPQPVNELAAVGTLETAEIQAAVLSFRI